MKLSVVLRKLKMNQSQLAEKLGVHFTSVSPWNKKGIPEKYHDKINKLLENKPVGGRPVKAKKRKVKEPVISQIAEFQESSPSSKKVMIVLLDPEDAKEYVKKFLSGEVG